MKIISLSILSILVSLSLQARENPFEPTDQFLEQKEIIIKSNEEAELKKQQDEKNRIAQEFEDQKMAELKIAEKMMAENKAKEEMEKKKLQMAQADEKAKSEMKVEAKVEKTIETTPVVKEKPYVPTIVENFKVLPFVKIHVENDIITIQVDPQYPLLNQDILKPAKKFLFDFKGNVSFYTIRKDILSEDFQSFAVGTHMEKNYFRVVINLTDEMINYTETIDSKNGIITIKKK